MEIKIYSEDEVALLDIDAYRSELGKANTEKLVTEIQYIDYTTVKKTNAKVARGTTSTLKKGSKGEKEVVYTVTYDSNGKEIAKNVISERVTKEAVNKVVEVGTKVTTVSRSNYTRVSASALKVDSNFKKYNIKLSEELQKYAYNMCKKYGVPYVVFLAMMKVESGYRTNAKSSTGYGLCQINPSNLSYLRGKIGTTDLMDPYQNIQAGAYWLSRYYKSWKKSASGETLSLHALNSYNWGEGNYRSYLKRGNTASSWYYGTKVLSVAAKLEKNGGL